MVLTGPFLVLASLWLTDYLGDYGSLCVIFLGLIFINVCSACLKVESFLIFFAKATKFLLSPIICSSSSLSVDSYLLALEIILGNITSLTTFLSLRVNSCRSLSHWATALSLAFGKYSCVDLCSLWYLMLLILILSSFYYCSSVNTFTVLLLGSLLWSWNNGYFEWVSSRIALSMGWLISDTVQTLGDGISG